LIRLFLFAFQGIGFKPGGEMHEPYIEVVKHQLIFLIVSKWFTYTLCIRLIWYYWKFSVCIWFSFNSDYALCML